MIDERELRVLLIEDNPGDVVIVKDYVAENLPRAVVCCASSIGEARSALVEQHRKFSVVLLDLTLPDGSGLDVVQTIVDAVGSTPVIVLTGQSELQLARPAMSVGATDYLLKDEITPMSVYKSIVYAMERMQYTVRLRASEQRYTNIFDLCPLPMWLFDVQTLQFMDVNRAAVQHYGWTRQEFLCMTIEQIRPPEHRGELLKTIAEVRGLEQSHGREPFVHWTRDGRRMHVDIQSSLVVVDGREARLVVATDVTDNLLYVQAITRQNQQLRDIAWMHSHTIRGPLTSIMGLVTLIEEDLVELDEIGDICRKLSYSAHTLDDVIRGIVQQTNEIGV